MSKRVRATAIGAAVITAALLLSACGGSSGTKSGSQTAGNSSAPASTSTAVKTGGTVTVLAGTSPDSLDPDFGYTTQASEADVMVYVPLLTYAAKSGTGGTTLIPGLLTALPTVSADQLTYSMQLRTGIKYSDGTPVKASDFTHAIERSIRIAWGGSSFFTGYIKGAADYSAKKTTGISGIVTDDATGKITVTLTTPYGAFDNLIAFPASAPIPSTTPFKVLSNNPPIGDGPYKFGTIVPNASYTLVRNPAFAGYNIPGIPTGYADTIKVSVQSNTTTEAQQVLDNQADVFDAGDSLPAGVISQVQSQAKDRYEKVPLASVYYFFLNTRVAPFNNVQARLAVNMAVDRTALARLSSGSLTPACYFLPPTIVGHSSSTCPYGDVNSVPSKATVAKAKQMIASAGLAGTPVTVWSETRSPRQQFCVYYADLLNQLGFKASIKVITDAVYFQTIGNESLNPQTGFADWSQDFPNPSDFYLLLSKAGIQSTNNQNFGDVNDPKLETQLAPLQRTPAAQLASSQSGWEALDQYSTSQGYTVPYGYETAPKFLSNKVDFNAAVFNPVYYILFSTLGLKK